jgi:LemA protein
MIPSLILIVALLLLFWSVGVFQRLRQLHLELRQAFTQLGEQLRRRHQIVADFIESAKDEALLHVMSAHSYATNAGIKADNEPADPVAVRGMSAAEIALSQSLRDVAGWTQEHAPNVFTELTDVNKSIGFAWQLYNHSAGQYNAAVKQFPSSVVATLFAFRVVPTLLPQPK